MGLNLIPLMTALLPTVAVHAMEKLEEPANLFLLPKGARTQFLSQSKLAAV